MFAVSGEAVHSVVVKLVCTFVVSENEYIMNKIDPSVLERLKPIAIPNGWDIVRRVGVLMDKAVYQLSNSSIPAGAKVGYPHLYFSDGVQLSHEQVLLVIKQDLFQSGGDCSQKITS